MLYELGSWSQPSLRQPLVLPMRAYFHRAAILGLTANILVLPLAGIDAQHRRCGHCFELCFHAFRTRLPPASPPLALHWTLAACIDWLANFHVAQWRVPDPAPLLVLLGGCWNPSGSGHSAPATCACPCGLAALFISSGIVAVYHAARKIESGKLEITAIDVGQGDSILVVSPQGRTMLIDGGGSTGRCAANSTLARTWLRPIFGRAAWRILMWLSSRMRMKITSADCRASLRTFIHQSYGWALTPEHARVVASLTILPRRIMLPVRKHTAGEEFAWGGTKIRVLSPPARLATEAKTRQR